MGKNIDSLRRVLVVDDSKLFLAYIAEVFQEKKFIEIRSVNDPQNALQEALDFHPEIILTDLEMPHPNGIELLKQFKNHDLFKSTPVIVLSSSEAEKNLILAIENGAHDYLIKNINPKLIISKIINLLNHKRVLDNEGKLKQLETLNDYITLSKHEFNNALFISNGYIRKLKKDISTEERLNSVMKIEEMNVRIEKLLNKLEELKNIKVEDFDEKTKFLKIEY